MKKILLLSLLFMSFSFTYAIENYDSVKSYLLKGNSEKEAGRHKMALDYFQKAVAADPKQVEANRLLGIEALETRQYDLARKSFLTVLESNPNDIVSLQKVTEIFFSYRRWDDAIKYGTHLLTLDNVNRLNYMIGKSFYEKEDYGNSFKYLEAAFKEDSKNSEIPTLFARALVDMSNFKAAVRYYSAAVELDQNNSRLLNEMAMAYSAMNDDKSAVVYFEKAIEKGYKIDDDFIENISNSYVAAGMPEKGTELMKNLLEKRPGDIAILNNLADNYYKAGNYKEAINYWDKVLYLDKEDARALYMIGMSYLKTGDKNNGETLCNKAIEMDPSLKQFRSVKGMPGQR